MKNPNKKRVIAFVLCLALFCSTGVTVFAVDGEETPETVYVLLDTQGGTKEIIVKNYSGENKVMSEELPFIIKLSYRLNGKAEKPEDILGKSGDVKITVDIKANSKSKAYYKEKLALQMQFPINTEDKNASDIVAKGLSGVNIGYTKTLSGIVMPSNSASYEISYKTENFEQQSVNFICMPFDLTGMVDFDFSSIEKQVSELQTAIAQYVDGVNAVSKGMSEANSGIKKISASNESLLNGYAQATAGETALLKAMLAALPTEQQKLFEPQIQAVMSGQKQISESLKQYCGGVSQSGEGLNQLSAAATELAKNGEQLKAGINSAIEPLSALAPQLPLPTQEAVASVPESFISEDRVSEIQFVMKTDALTATQEKQDVTPAAKPKKTFWSRLLALFGL